MICGAWLNIPTLFRRIVNTYSIVGAMVTYPLLRVPEACKFLRTEFGMSYSPRPFRGKGLYFGYLAGIVLLMIAEVVYCLLKHKRKRERIMAVSCMLVLSVLGFSLIFHTFSSSPDAPAFPSSVMIQSLDIIFIYIMARKTRINNITVQNLANMSHEIRTPMNSIIGMSESLLREKLDDHIATDVLHIQTAGNHLLGIINEILDISKIEAGKYNLVNAEYNLGETLLEMIHYTKARLKDKDVEFRYRVEPNVPGILSGDVLRIKQILTNILGNAVKFTKEGSIDLAVSCQMPEEKKVQLTFVVADTGMGLPIAKHLSELMGGTITVESTYGKGTTFTITICQEVVDAAPVNLEQTSANELKNYREKQEKKETASCEGITVLDVAYCKTVPVIALTANAIDGVREELLANDFDDYLSKPIDINKLGEILEKYLA